MDGLPTMGTVGSLANLERYKHRVCYIYEKNRLRFIMIKERIKELSYQMNLFSSFFQFQKFTNLKFEILFSKKEEVAFLTSIF